MGLKEEGFMRLALELALKGWPDVASNPMVGCVIVKNGEVLASGYHRRFGEAHAEVNAIAEMPVSVAPNDCELYVSLEPCAHHGKTPPCAELIIKKGFKKVIVASGDPNPLVNGKGTALLKAAGIEVVSGILETQARDLNRRFYTFHEKKRPFISLKWAESADGFISRLPVPEKREDNLISGPEALAFAHRLRAEHMGILVGKNTVLADDPSLTTRLVTGKSPVKIILDSRLEVPRSAKIFAPGAKTLVFNALKEGQEGDVQFIRLHPERQDPLKQVLNTLYDQGIQSLLVEGGSSVLQSFIRRELFDAVYKIVNPRLKLQNGVKAPAFLTEESQAKHLGTDLLYRV
ncbi:MAG: bifunctional diaminohydroxyphosphoribosylaminopyrimidine deaminase/5-amino-6-(5-phosphoribosylamino)uracil reductase RibD [Bacteroidia bacterium]|jgi:diaminohydroxyphosphoribosylaminopyrimidine deaminase/5-amino-6-(5-phosphoribosylamino)uracil reductase|nr:bifunctional diaminohydroxyphosphoribosylaminopyrimidine deaminase/5-amino-6-(5-phosphoribosylamino)uracil reductase RibD [Bacteroidia bacterium]